VVWVGGFRAWVALLVEGCWGTRFGEAGSVACPFGVGRGGRVWHVDCLDCAGLAIELERVGVGVQHGGPRGALLWLLG